MTAMTAERSRTLANWLGEAPFTLTLSSGFFGFFAHCGMLAALTERGLSPARVSGASAGALVGGAWASGVEAHALRDVLFALERRDFWDPRPGLGLLRGERFLTKLRATLGASSFSSCRVPVALSLWDIKARQTVVANAGDLATAIAGSCALPGLFQPVRWNERLVLDGGIADRPGLAGAPPDQRTLFHHLSSRSPWRRANSPALRVPTRPGLVSLVIDGLPRVNPFRLEVGQTAFAKAHAATAAALDQPIVHDVVQRVAQ